MEWRLKTDALSVGDISMGQFAGTQTDKYPPTATPTPGYPYNQGPARRPAQIPSVFATLQTALHKSICTTKSAPAGGWWTSQAPHVLRAVSGSPRRLRVLLTAAEMWNIMLKNGLHQPYRFSGRLRLDRGPHSRALPGFKKTVLSNVSLSNAVCRQAASLCAALYMVTTAEF